MFRLGLEREGCPAGQKFERTGHDCEITLGKGIRSAIHARWTRTWCLKRWPEPLHTMTALVAFRIRVLLALRNRSERIPAIFSPGIESVVHSSQGSPALPK